MFPCWPTLIWWMRLRPSSLIFACLLSSGLSLGIGWGLTPGWGWSLVMDGVCWREWGRETPVESLHDRLHISHTRVGLVFTKVQNWHIHCGRERRGERKEKIIHVKSTKQSIHHQQWDKPVWVSLQAEIQGWAAPVQQVGVWPDGGAHTPHRGCCCLDSQLCSSYTATLRNGAQTFPYVNTICCHYIFIFQVSSGQQRFIALSYFNLFHFSPDFLIFPPL